MKTPAPVLPLKAPVSNNLRGSKQSSRSSCMGEIKTTPPKCDWQGPRIRTRKVGVLAGTLNVPALPKHPKPPGHRKLNHLLTLRNKTFFHRPIENICDQYDGAWDCPNQKDDPKEDKEEISTLVFGMH
jgi:hypothetical protein